jgi:hypothetical protein
MLILQKNQKIDKSSSSYKKNENFFTFDFILC